MQRHKWAPFAVTLLVAAAFMLLAGVAIAQDQKPGIIVQGDTFPAALGYAAIGVAGTVWATLATVVAKLYYGREQDRKESQAQLDQIKKDAQAHIDALKKECKDEISKLRDRLELEQRERREEAEKLLREQKDIMREVMVTCAAISDALRKNTDTLERMMHTWRDDP